MLDACFFEQLANGGFFEGFIVFDTTTRRGPVVSARQGTCRVYEAKQQYCAVGIEDEQAGGWATAHDAVYRDLRSVSRMMVFGPTTAGSRPQSADAPP